MTAPTPPARRHRGDLRPVPAVPRAEPEPVELEPIGRAELAELEPAELVELEPEPGGPRVLYVRADRLELGGTQVHVPPTSSTPPPPAPYPFPVPVQLPDPRAVRAHNYRVGPMHYGTEHVDHSQPVSAYIPAPVKMGAGIYLLSIRVILVTMLAVAAAGGILHVIRWVW